MNMVITKLISNTAHKLRISTGNKNLGKVKNKTATWAQLIEKMSTPLIDIQHTLPQYLQLSVARQGELKNVGFFVGGHCDNGVRQIGSIKERWLITLDVDDCSVSDICDLEMGSTELAPFEFFVYSTRKHTRAKPRLRIIIPLAEPCDAEAYHALSRIVGEFFDVTMESIDPVSYRATQLMYWPSVCKDAEFYTYHNPGSLLVPNEVLDGFGDWKDHTKLPRSERDDSNYNPAGKKPEDPTEKEGFVGAFCRVYDVPAAIDEFLPEIYVDPKQTGQGVRYTYAKGTTAHGAIVYDGGNFLYSNHMHDPAAGHSQNAFDLVRIHLFGHLDAKVREGTSPLNYPSVKALLDQLKGDKRVSKALRDENYDLNRAIRPQMDDDGAFDDLDRGLDTQAGIPPKKAVLNDPIDWMENLDLSSDGLIKATMHNAVLILMNDARFAGCVRRNLFNQRKVYYTPIDFSQFGNAELTVADKVNGSDWTDAHTRFVKLMLESPRGKNKPGYGLKLSDKDLNDAIDHAADRQSFHPVRNYLSALKWDGRPRLARVFVDYLGATDDEYHIEVCTLTLLAAVVRIFEPGHKFDFMPVLEGVQGKRKSSFVNALAKGLWFREMGDIGDKNKTIEAMSGAWILEFAELHQFGRAEVNHIKQFITAAGETSRLAYERNTKTFLRQCVFIGTTNDDEYLRDPTGNRRFWPVHCYIDEIDIERLERNIDQIWAEGVHLYKMMRFDQPFGLLPLYFVNKEIEKTASRIQSSRKILANEEIMADQIETWLELPISENESKGWFLKEDESAFDEDSPKLKRTKTCAAEIYEKVLLQDRHKIATDKSAQYLIARAMRLIPGWERSDQQGRYGDYGKQRVLYTKRET